MDDPRGDLTRSPLAYPLEPVTGARLLLPGCEHPLRLRPSGPLGAARVLRCPVCEASSGGGGCGRLDRTLGALGRPPVARRTPVLAVGSNAAASVMRHKLSAHGVSAVLPVLPGVVHGLAVQHSAHVARGGYVPAAPAHRHGVRTPVLLQLLDDDQLDALDATEPNYDRVEVSTARYPLLLTGALRPHRVQVYASRWGVVGLPAAASTGLLSQVDLLAALHAVGVPHTDGAPSRAASLLATSAPAREALREALARLGLTRPAGLRAEPAGQLSWVDAVSGRAAPCPRPRSAARRRTGRARGH